MLHELQRDFAHALFAPHGAAVLDRIAAEGLEPARRLFVHYNTIAGSLTRVLQNAYPALFALIGADAFQQAAARHIRLHPPREAALLHYGDGFGDTAAAMTEDCDPALIRDVAAIEWAQKQAFHAADAPVLTRATLREIGLERMPALYFTPHPALRLVATETDALAAWRTALALPAQAATRHVAVTRPDTAVQTHALPLGTHTLVAALADGATLAHAAETAADPAIDLTAAIGTAVDIGCFAAFHA